MQEQSDVAVVGAGAAGLLAALAAARAGASTVLLEGSAKVGAKILISGGGRCNVLPGSFEEGAFFTAGSRNVLRRLFRTWPLDQVRAFFEQDLAVPLRLEEETGKLFPRSDRARTVRDALVEACHSAGVRLETDWRVASLEPHSAGFALQSAVGAALRATTVVLATGGQSVPKTGSDGHGYQMARALGHSLLPPYPALVPLLHAEADLHALAGISLPIAWRTHRDGRTLDSGLREALLTHQGLSGPAILDASHWIEREGAALEIGWGGRTAAAWDAALQDPSARTVGAVLTARLPRRLGSCLLRRAELAEDHALAQLSRARRRRLARLLGAFPLPVTGSRGFAVAEVTGGGIPLDEVQPSTLESRRQSGLFLCGEILDCIGRIGGHNFLWAWVTGRLAGTQAARATKARAVVRDDESV